MRLSCLLPQWEGAAAPPGAFPTHEWVRLIQGQAGSYFLTQSIKQTMELLMADKSKTPSSADRMRTWVFFGNGKFLQS